MESPEDKFIFSEPLENAAPFPEQYQLPTDFELYPGLEFSRIELARVMRSYYDDLIAVVAQAGFQDFYSELMGMPRRNRPKFVADVMFDSTELLRRNIVIPSDVLVQLSSFGDRRPTLFALKKLLPEKFAVAWENVNLTFGNEYEDSMVPRTPEGAWRAPLPIALQNKLLSSDEDLQAVPDDLGVSFGIYAFRDRKG